MSDSTSETVPFSEWTPEFFSSVLQDHFGKELQVQEVRMERIEEGVLSHVMQVHLTYTKPEPDFPPNVLAKQPRDDPDMRRMFEVECTFYSKFAAAKLDAPFLLPKMYHASPSCLVLEYLPNVTTYPLYPGCPNDKVEICLQSLAILHARQWGCDWSALASPAGMGAWLPSPTKLELAQKHQAGFLEPLQVVPKTESTEMMNALFAWRPQLDQVHDRVYNTKWTLVHGDYHIANWLFDSSSPDQKYWLLDWGTCGLGNPLVDLVFFLVVSTQIDLTTDLERHVRMYYDMLTDPNNSSNGDKIKASLGTYEDCQQLARLCLINQLLIFVAYDPMVRAMGAKDHFDRVHGRAVQALLSSFMDYRTFLEPQSE